MKKVFLFGLILGLCAVYVCINIGQHKLINEQQQRIDDLRNKYDSLSVEYIRYRIDNEKIN